MKTITKFTATWIGVIAVTSWAMVGCQSHYELPDENITRTLMKQTGQIRSFSVGHEVTRGAVRDDGYYQAGLSPKYTRDDASNIVTDTITQLQWQDNPAVATQKMSDKEAVTYCQNLTLGGYNDWYLPSVDELMYIMDLTQRANPSLDPSFKHNGIVGNNGDEDRYWTHTKVIDGLMGDPYPWAVSTSGGAPLDGVQNESILVRCVRSPSADTNDSVRFKRRDTGVVSDLKYRLQWQDDYGDNGGQIKKTSWSDALNYCENLALDGHDDWRLPNLNELYYLSDKTRSQPAIDPVFIHTALDYYWTSTTPHEDPYYAQSVGFYSGTISWLSKVYERQPVRCVRTLQEQ